MMFPGGIGPLWGRLPGIGYRRKILRRWRKITFSSCVSAKEIRFSRALPVGRLPEHLWAMESLSGTPEFIDYQRSSNKRSTNSLRRKRYALDAGTCFVP